MAKNANDTAISTNNQPDLDFIKSLGMGALDDLSSNDITMPRYKLVQNTSKKGTPGKFVSNISEDEYDYLSMAIIGIGNYQIMFAPTGEGDKPLCRSNNGVTKASLDGMGDAKCNGCRYNVWTKDVNGNPVPPKCKSGYSLLGFIFNPDGTYNVGVVSVKGTAMKPAKQYFTKMKSRGVAPFAYLTKISANTVVNAKGRFFQTQLDFLVTDPTAPDYYLPSDMILALSEQAKGYTQFVGSAALVDDEVETDNVQTNSGAQDFLNSLGGTGTSGDDELQS